jgi:hypothetical protein
MTINLDEPSIVKDNNFMEFNISMIFIGEHVSISPINTINFNLGIIRILASVILFEIMYHLLNSYCL